MKTRDIGVQARLEELWVIKMKLEREKNAREELEAKMDEMWKERGKLVNTNDKYLEYFSAQGIDPKEILNGQAMCTNRANARTGCEFLSRTWWILLTSNNRCASCHLPDKKRIDTFSELDFTVSPVEAVC